MKQYSIFLCRWDITKDLLLKNHILLLFKIYVYNSKKHEKISLSNLIRNVTKVKNIEKKIGRNNERKIMLYQKKWEKIETQLNENGYKSFKSLINLSMGWGVEHFCCEISVVFCYYLFIYFNLVFFLCFFVCVCVINVWGSFVILFLCYLIKNEINITIIIIIIIIIFMINR